MDRKTESGQVMAELILVVLMIGALFIFIMDRGAMVREQLGMTRFSSSSSKSRVVSSASTSFRPPRRWRPIPMPAPVGRSSEGDWLERAQPERPAK